MASGFFAVLDDIGTLMDDVTAMSKIATKKTAGILGDDLAVNAEKASGFVSSREIPVLWAITKGSFLNKLITLPIAFLLSAFLTRAITLIVLLGGLFLAFEGAEKIYEFFTPHAKKDMPNDMTTPSENEIWKMEKSKIKSAIITDLFYPSRLSSLLWAPFSRNPWQPKQSWSQLWPSWLRSVCMVL